MMLLNRVGDSALSATGTGSCLEDEGRFCDAVTAPAASYWTYLLYVATILGRANGRLLVCLPGPPVIRICKTSPTICVGFFYGFGAAWIVRSQKKEDFIMRKSKLTVRRMAINAVMIAIYVVLAMYLTIPLGGLKITIEALPVIICAVLFGPADAAIVGGLAEFINQLLTFGITPTTALWVLPAVVRGLFIGFCLLPMRKKSLGQPLLHGKRMIWFYIICLVSAVIVSCLNTFTLYVDSKMFGYYSYAMVFGSFVLRIITGLVATTAMSAMTVPLVTAMRKARLVS